MSFKIEDKAWINDIEGETIREGESRREKDEERDEMRDGYLLVFFFNKSERN